MNAEFKWEKIWAYMMTHVCNFVFFGSNFFEISLLIVRAYQLTVICKEGLILSYHMERKQSWKGTQSGLVSHIVFMVVSYFAGEPVSLGLRYCQSPRLSPCRRQLVWYTVRPSASNHACSSIDWTLFSSLFYCEVSTSSNWCRGQHLGPMQKSIEEEGGPDLEFVLFSWGLKWRRAFAV